MGSNDMEIVGYCLRTRARPDGIGFKYKDGRFKECKRKSVSSKLGKRAKTMELEVSRTGLSAEWWAMVGNDW
jgi:hypothetical protein